MGAPKYINTSEFIEFLKKENLIIVSATEFELNNVLIRKKLLKKKALSLKEIIDGKFFPIKDTKTLIDWIERGKILKVEWYQEQTGRKRIMILTQALKRLGCEA
jgi:hypothetical protein